MTIIGMVNRKKSLNVEKLFERVKNLCIGFTQRPVTDDEIGFAFKNNIPEKFIKIFNNIKAIS